MKAVERYEDYLEAAALEKKIVLFGASTAGIRFMERYRFYADVAYFCDNDEKKWKTRFMGKKIFPPSKLLDEVNGVIVIITSMYYKEIHAQLKEMGITHIYSPDIFRFRRIHTKGILDEIEFHSKYTNDIYGAFLSGNSYTEPLKSVNANEDNIELARSFLSDNESVELYDKYLRKRKYCYFDYYDMKDEGTQYFDTDILSFSDSEVFADVGCFDGVTSAQFAEIVCGKFEKIYAFEPDPNCFSKCTYTLSHDENINDKYEFIPMGASDITGKEKFYQSDKSSRPNPDGKVWVELCRIDDKINGRVSFIKMDIEGGELKALKGAQNIIKTHKPKLAISIYHYIEDLWEIPLYIKELVPEYKFYVRHYSDRFIEFVLYATI